MNTKIFSIGFFLLYQIGFSQKDSIDNYQNKYRYITFQWNTGSHFYTGNEHTGNLLKHGYGAGEVKLGWQTTDEHEWAKYYGYPSYGIGIYSGFIGDPNIFGKPKSIFSFINFPITNDSKRNIFSIEPSLGLTYQLKPYDKIHNPLNEAIGAKMAVYFNLKFGFNYKINREIDLEYGLGFTHFSNGRTFTPNYGLNMVGLQLGLKYFYNPNQRKINKNIYNNQNLLPVRYLRPNKIANIKVDKPHSINTFVAISSVQNDIDMGTSKRYIAASGIVEYQYKINNAHGVSAGIDYFFDKSLDETFPNNPEKKHQWGTHIGYDFMFNKFTIIGQVGVYLNNNNNKGDVFLRPAIRYDLTPKIYTQLGLKTLGTEADWVELGIGFRPFRW